MSCEKFRALVHFLIDECVDAPSRLGAVRLNKALWFSDVYAYKLYGSKITAEKYVKRQMGPVPATILSALKTLCEDGKIQIIEPTGLFDTRKFISLERPNLSCLTTEQLETARYALDFVCGEAALKISEITHDLIWQSAEIGEEIPVFTTLAANICPLNEETISWANQVIMNHVS